MQHIEAGDTVYFLHDYSWFAPRLLFQFLKKIGILSEDLDNA